MTRTPCATPPYWQDVTTTYIKTTTIKVYPTPHVEHEDDGYLAKPSKAAVVLPPPAEYSPAKPHVEKPDAPYKPSNPAAPSMPASPVGGGKGYDKPDTPASPVGGSGNGKGYDTPASPVGGSGSGKGYDTPAAPVAPSKSYGAGDSWPLAGPTPSGGNKYQPTSTYGAKPSQFTGGASSNAAIGGGFLAAALGVVAGMLL